MSAFASTSPAPSAGTRDYVVDWIKGIACLLMVVAHVPFPQLPWLATATMASVMFFSSTGMNLFGLAERRPGDEARIAANGLFLIFAGFADNYVLGTLGKADVFQSAGMAMIAMLLLRRLTPRYWTWLFPLPYLIHLLNQVFFWKTTDGGLSSFFLAPGLFPLLPWLTFYLYGAHLKRYNSSRLRLTMAALALAGVGLLRLWRPFDFNKYWMSADYWLIGLAMIALLLETGRHWERGWRRRDGVPGWAEIRLWGSNSLAFYILLAFVIRSLELAFNGGWLLLAGSIAGTAALLRVALAVQARSKRSEPWKVLAVTGLVAATVLWVETLPVVQANYLLRTAASFGLTFGFVAAYPAYKNLTVALSRPVGGRRKPPRGAGQLTPMVAAQSIDR